MFLSREDTSAEKFVEKGFSCAVSQSCPVINELGEQIQSFLKGEPINFTLDVIALGKCTESQKKVLTADCKIPRGWVSTYGNYSAYSPDLPGCITTGETREEVEQNMHSAIEMHVCGLVEDNLPVPETQLFYRRRNIK